MKTFIEQVWSELEPIQQIAEFTNNFESINENRKITVNQDFDYLLGFPFETITNESGTWLKTLQTFSLSDNDKIRKQYVGKVYNYTNENKPTHRFYIRYLGCDNGFGVTEKELSFLCGCALKELEKLENSVSIAA